MENYYGKQHIGPYTLSNSSFDIVKRLIEPIENYNRNLTTDNYYTSVPLADYLLEEKIALNLTLKKNKRKNTQETKIKVKIHKKRK